MAPKGRSNHLDEPPSASSGEYVEEDEEEPVSKAESDPEEEKDDEEDDDDDEESDEEDTVHSAPPPVNKPSVQKPTRKPQPYSIPESDEGSDSESESDKTQQSPNASDFTIKPIESKPIDPKSKKPAASDTPAKTPAKRPSAKEENGKDSVQKKKKKKIKVSNGDEEDQAVEEKKGSGITRLWSEEDEIAVLKGMINYQAKKGADPYADMAAFHEFVKGSLHVEVSKLQLTDKIRRLKKKYQNNAEKGENGEDPVFSKPHDHKTFELSKKIWGGGTASGIEENGKSGGNGKPRKTSKVSNNVLASQKEDEKAIVLKEEVKSVEKNDKKDFWSKYPRLYGSMQLEKHPNLSFQSDMNILMDNLQLIGNQKAKELEEKWKNLRVEEIRLYSKRLELIHEQVKLALAAATKSPNS